MMDEKVMSVKCEICGKEFQQITVSHLQTHGVTMKEYRTKFPNSPIVSFTATRRKVADVFKDQESKTIETEDIIYEEEEPDTDVIIEELDFDEIPDDVTETYVDTDQADDYCSIQKDTVLEILKKFFSNVKKDYLVRERSVNGSILYECITDFADPVLRIDIEFPNTFWHNQEPWNTSRDQRLKEFGWRVINIYSKAPTFKDINKAISELNL